MQINLDTTYRGLTARVKPNGESYLLTISDADDGVVSIGISGGDALMTIVGESIGALDDRAEDVAGLLVNELGTSMAQELAERILQEILERQAMQAGVSS